MTTDFPSLATSGLPPIDLPTPDEPDYAAELRRAFPTATIEILTSAPDFVQNGNTSHSIARNEYCFSQPVVAVALGNRVAHIIPAGGFGRSPRWRADIYTIDGSNHTRISGSHSMEIDAIRRHLTSS